jgi:hypothetical protein
MSIFPARDHTVKTNLSHKPKIWSKHILPTKNIPHKTLKSCHPLGALTLSVGWLLSPKRLENSAPKSDCLILATYINVVGSGFSLTTEKNKEFLVDPNMM